MTTPHAATYTTRQRKGTSAGRVPGERSGPWPASLVAASSESGIVPKANQDNRRPLAHASISLFSRVSRVSSCLALTTNQISVLR